MKTCLNTIDIDKIKKKCEEQEKLKKPCPHCEKLREIFKVIKNKREYWLFTEIYTYLHDGNDYCKETLLKIGGKL